MSQLLRFVFSVSGVVLSLLVAALWCWMRPRSLAARRFLVGIAAVYTLASIYAVPHTIARVLTTGYERFDKSDLPADKTAVVLLGAGSQVVQGWNERLYPLSATGTARVLETSRLFKRLSPAWVISSGGLADAAGPQQLSSVTMRDMLVQLGVPAGRIMLESESINTHDEAVLVAPMLRSLGVGHVVLVTSDIHMRRSMGAFRAQGIAAFPAIAPDPRSALRWTRWIYPTVEGLDFSAEVVHELVGIPYYWMRGWWRSA